MNLRHFLFFLTILSSATVLAQEQPTVENNHIDMLNVHRHKDGARTNYFVTSLIDSITFSPIGVDSLRYPDWKTLEIWTRDSVYRMDKTDTDSISFSHANLLQVIDDLVHVSKECGTLFMSCNSTAQLGKHLDAIKAIEGVEDAWIDPQTLFVKIRNWGLISYLYPLKINTYNLSFSQLARKYVIDNDLDGDHVCTDGRRVCIVNTTHEDDNFSSAVSVENDLINKFLFVNDGFKVVRVTEPGISFFTHEMFGYDVVFLMTHGCWDGQYYWMSTGELLTSSDTELDKEELTMMLMKRHPLLYKPDCLNVMGSKEKRGENEVMVYHIAISDNYISESANRFDSEGESIIFNVACQSMMKGSRLVQTYMNKGAGCYLGFNDVNTIGEEAGQEFFTQLLHGKSIQSISHSFPQNLKSESFEWEGMTYSPTLKIRFNENPNICLLKPNKLERIEDNSNHNSIYLKFHGSMPTLEADGFWNYGFVFSKTAEMDEKIIVIANEVTMANGHAEFTAMATGDDLEENTTYYCAAYYKDNGNYCYGDVVELTTPIILPAVETLKASDIDGEEKTAILQARITPFKKSKNIKVGFVVSTTNRDPKIGGEDVVMSSLSSTDQLESEVFMSTLGNLVDKSMYYYRGFAVAVPDGYEQEETEVEYGDVKSFYFKEAESYMVALEATDVMFDSATLNGEIYILSKDRENPAVAAAEVGFYWGRRYDDNWQWISLGSLKNLNNGKVSVPVGGLNVGESYYYSLTLRVPDYDSTPEDYTWCTSFQTADIDIDEETNLSSFGVRLNAHIERNDCVADLAGLETGFLVGPNEVFVSSEEMDGNGSFTASLSNLFPFTIYRVVACVRVNGKVIKGRWGSSSFMTAHYPFSVTVSAENVSSSSATLKANVLDSPSITSDGEMDVLFKYEAKNTHLPDDMEWKQNIYSYLANVSPYRDIKIGEPGPNNSFSVELGPARLVGNTTYELIVQVTVWCHKTGVYGEEYDGETFETGPLTFSTGEWPTKPTGGFVDLGAGVLWSYANVGATHPTDIGSRFAWGEAIADKISFERENYAFTDKVYDADGMCIGDTIRYLGDVITSLATLSQTDDPELLYCILPTVEDFGQLRVPTWCKWRGVEGVLLFGPNGNCIFMPHSGYAKEDQIYDYTKYVGYYGYYWTGNQYPSKYNYDTAYAAKVSSNDLSPEISELDIHGVSRWYGCSLRMVKLPLEK